MVWNISGADRGMTFIHLHGVICVVMRRKDTALIERLHGFSLNRNCLAHDMAFWRLNC